MMAPYAILLFSAAYLVLAIYALLLAPFLPPSRIPLLDALATDSHYKYFSVLVIPATVYFIIANWVGWQYYRNS